MKKIKIFSIFLMLVIAFAGCKKDDFTGHSTLTPTNPTITVDLGTLPGNMIDGISYKHTITLNMDVAQIVDVAVHVEVKEGTMTEGEDFTMPHTVTIPTGRTQVSFEVVFNGDTDPEDTETLTITIGDERTANAAITPVDVSYSADNFSSDDLMMTLSWMNVTPLFYPDGEEYDATTLADMIFTIYHIEGDSVYAEADGASYEELILPATAPNGTYRVMTSYWSISDPGLNSDLDFTLTFEQTGLYTTDVQFPAFLSIYTYNSCVGPHMMMDITKVGTDWSWEFYVDPLADYLGNWGGLDGTEKAPDNLDMYPSEVVTTVCGSDLYMNGLNHGWMVDFWGEEILESVPFIITLNVDNTVTVDSAYYMTTLYDGAPYQYSIIDVVGTWDESGTISLQYELYNSTDGYEVAELCLSYALCDYDYFTAELDINAKSLNKIINSGKSQKVRAIIHR